MKDKHNEGLLIMTTIAALLTVFNRKDKTLQCLRNLFAQTLPNGCHLDVWLTDDGCTDDTPECIKELFPQVNIVEGDGSLFWNRGMHKAWTYAASHLDYDYYLWLNDDTYLYPDAIATLLNTAKQHTGAIIVGTTCSSKGHNGEKPVITYGGRHENYSLISPKEEPQACALFNGNIVLIPRSVYNVVGTNDPLFRHALGDFDYGMRAAKKGIASYVAAGIMGECNEHETLPTWCNPQKSLSQRWRAFKKPTGQNPEEFFVFEKRHHGLAKACFHYITNYVRMLFPYIWKLKQANINNVV